MFTCRCPRNWRTAYLGILIVPTYLCSIVLHGYMLAARPHNG